MQVWNPYLAKDIDVLEKVQRHATKLLHGLSYEDRLERLDLYSLFCRRQRGDLIEVFKILNNYYDIEPSTFFTINNSSITRGHQFKLFKVRSRLMIRQHFFTNRIVNLWNSLPSSIVTAPTVQVLIQKNIRGGGWPKLATISCNCHTQNGARLLQEMALPCWWA